MRIIHSISILVILEISSLIANNSASEVVVLSARALEDVIWWLSSQKCLAEIAYIFLGEYSTCTSDNNKSKERRGYFMTKMIQGLQMSCAIIET